MAKQIKKKKKDKKNNSSNDKSKEENVIKKSFFKFVDGTSYKGEYCIIDNVKKRHGIGQTIFQNGDIYNGEYKNDMINGKGKYIFKNGDIYEGKFFKYIISWLWYIYGILMKNILVNGKMVK